MYGMYDILIAKLHAYGFEMISLKFLFSYLSGREQRVRVGQNFSPWNEIKLGVPQGSILGPLFFNVFICDTFYCVDNMDFAG